MAWLRRLTLCTVAAVAVSQDVAVEDALAPANVTAPESPLQKVVSMLQDMKATVEKDADDDKLAFDKYACWCSTTEKEKTAAVEEATKSIDELASFIEEAAAKSGALTTEVEALTDDIAEGTEALEQAAAVREKEKTAFEGEEVELTETLAALKQALEILSKVQLVQKQDVQNAATSLLQVRDSVQRRFPNFKDVLQKDLFDVVGSMDEMARDAGLGQTTQSKGAALISDIFLPKRDAVALDQAAQEPDPSGLQGAAAGAKSYNSRSGGIFGILQEMNDEMGRDLTEAREEEKKATEAYAKLVKAKEGEVAAATEQKKMKETELAELNAKSADAKEDKEALTAAKASDEKFLANLKESCTAEAKAFDVRTDARSEEIRALGEALTILTEDDARDLFGKTMSFIQTSSHSKATVTMDRMSRRVMQRLAKLARKHKNWSLAALAVRIRLDSFGKVKEAMDKMTAELKAQQQEEYEKSELCKKEIDKAEDEIKVKQLEEKDLADQHQDISNTMRTLKVDIEKMSAEVSTMQSSLKQASESRKAENQIYQQAVSDQRATVQILNKALERLKMFYGTDDTAALVQVQAHRQEPGAAVAPAPPKPSGYTKSAGSGGVMQVFMMVITDAEVVETDLSASEQQAQSDYATLAADTNDSVNANREAIAKKEKQSAEAEASKSETEVSQTANTAALASLGELLSAHHTDCDWLLQYFDVRQQARQEELDSIADAKAILSGANFGTE